MIKKVITKYTGKMGKVLSQDGEWIHVEMEDGNRLFNEDSILEMRGDTAVMADPLGVISGSKKPKLGFACITSVFKKDLINAGIPKKEIHSEHDYGNWVFYIPNKYLVNIGWTPKAVEERILRHKRGEL